MTFGDYVRQRRIGLGFTLRAFTTMLGCDPSNHSKVERGRLPAPTGDALEALARALQVEPGTDEWTEFQDMAAASRAKGAIPADLDDKQVMSKLPVFFRAVRKGHKLTEDELNEFIQQIRQSG